MTMMRAVLASAFLLTATAATVDAADTAKLDAMWLAAIEDASKPEGSEIVTDLFNIAPWNPALHWKDPTKKEKVLVVSFMSSAKLAATFPNGQTTGAQGAAPAGWNIWVTAAPQLQNFCRNLGLSGDDLSLRIKQYIGLNYKWTYAGIAQMYVSPSDLYRPCADPQVNDKTCQLAGADQGTYAAPMDPEYKKWFDSSVAHSYNPNGAPWTQLGYTYDWSDGNNVGASEYVLRDNAPVEYVGLSTPDAYCAP